MTLTHISPLRVLGMRSERGELLANTVVLEDMALYMNQLAHLTKLQLAVAPEDINCKESL
jgi:hypothetical protein